MQQQFQARTQRLSRGLAFLLAEQNIMRHMWKLPTTPPPKAIYFAEDKHMFIRFLIPKQVFEHNLGENGNFLCFDL